MSSRSVSLSTDELKRITQMAISKGYASRIILSSISNALTRYTTGFALDTLSTLIVKCEDKEVQTVKPDNSHHMNREITLLISTLISKRKFNVLLTLQANVNTFYHTSNVDTNTSPESKSTTEIPKPTKLGKIAKFAYSALHVPDSSKVMVPVEVNATIEKIESTSQTEDIIYIENSSQTISIIKDSSENFSQTENVIDREAQTDRFRQKIPDNTDTSILMDYLYLLVASTDRHQNLQLNEFELEYKGLCEKHWKPERRIL